MGTDPLKALVGANDLLARASKILNEGAYIRPVPSMAFMQYYALNPLRAVVYNYYQEIPEREEENASIIIHGHNSSVPCSGPTFCHEKGWRPDESINPTFRRLFYLAHPGYGVQSRRKESVLERVHVSESNGTGKWDGELVLDSFF